MGFVSSLTRGLARVGRYVEAPAQLRAQYRYRALQQLEARMAQGVHRWIGPMVRRSELSSLGAFREELLPFCVRQTGGPLRVAVYGSNPASPGLSLLLKSGTRPECIFTNSLLLSTKPSHLPVKLAHGNRESYNEFDLIVITDDHSALMVDCTDMLPREAPDLGPVVLPWRFLFGSEGNKAGAAMGGSDFWNDRDLSTSAVVHHSWKRNYGIIDPLLINVEILDADGNLLHFEQLKLLPDETRAVSSQDLFGERKIRGTILMSACHPRIRHPELRFQLDYESRESGALASNHSLQCNRRNVSIPGARDLRLRGTGRLFACVAPAGESSVILGRLYPPESGSRAIDVGTELRMPEGTDERVYPRKFVRSDRNSVIRSSEWEGIGGDLRAKPDDAVRFARLDITTNVPEVREPNVMMKQTKGGLGALHSNAIKTFDTLTSGVPAGFRDVFLEQGLSAVPRPVPILPSSFGESFLLYDASSHTLGGEQLRTLNLTLYRISGEALDEKDVALTHDLLTISIGELFNLDPNESYCVVVRNGVRENGDAAFNNGGFEFLTWLLPNGSIGDMTHANQVWNAAVLVDCQHKWSFARSPHTYKLRTNKFCRVRHSDRYQTLFFLNNSSGSAHYDYNASVTCTLFNGQRESLRCEISIPPFGSAFSSVEDCFAEEDIDDFLGDEEIGTLVITEENVEIPAWHFVRNPNAACFSAEHFWGS